MLRAGANRLALAAFAAAWIALGGAFAQSSKQPAGPLKLSSDPESTSAAYGDWVTVCQRVVDPPKRLCEVSQSIQVQGQAGPIAQLAIGKPSDSAGMRITLLLPSNVALALGPKLTADDKDIQGVELAWARCLPGGCFSEAALKEDVLKRWRAMTDRGKIAFKDGIGRDVILPFSFRGLAQALDALAKE